MLVLIIYSISVLDLKSCAERLLLMIVIFLRLSLFIFRCLFPNHRAKNKINIVTFSRDTHFFHSKNLQTTFKLFRNFVFGSICGLTENLLTSAWPRPCIHLRHVAPIERRSVLDSNRPCTVRKYDDTAYVVFS